MIEAWQCPACEYENEAGSKVCEACDEPAPAATECGNAEDGDNPLANYKVGLVVSCEDAAGAKLKLLKVDVGDTEAIDVVTNATNVAKGSRIVVACVGATVGDMVVKRTQVKGHPSSGIVCDSVMLGWSGGGAGAAALLPEQFTPGSPPPASRPRGGPAGR